ncbi:YIP1 family protein [Domibacillus tundrae]|uniref:YIP1 family protein n=1 Tax=Domibacillus tundrae TaxID=1587527 RepID=UPI003396C282
MSESGLSIDQARNISLITGLITGVIMFPLTISISAGIMYLIVKIAGGDTTFKHLVSFTIFLAFIITIGQIINYGVALAAGTDPNVTSINGLLGLDGKMGGALNMVEIFTIWSVILTGTGLRVVASISKRAARIIVAVLSIVTIVIGFLMGTDY